MYDVVFENGMIVDTENKTLHTANLAVKDGIITEISSKSMPATRTIDATGLMVCPGFIDVHSHIDGNPRGAMLSAMQGITTVLSGNCGLSPLDMPQYFAKVKKQGICINEAMLVGHSFSLRKQAGINSENAKASQAQIDKMLFSADKALKNGAFGISLGLDYSPGASSGEIDAMARLCASYNRIFPVHTRLFTQNDFYSLYEMLSVAKRHSSRLLFSHFVYQYCGFGAMNEAINIVNKARENGINVYIDSGMYTDWATYVGTATFDVNTIADNALRFGSMICITGKYTGQRLNRELYTLLREKYAKESVVCFCGNEKEIFDTICQPYAMPSTDAGVYRIGEGHPQIAGTFPRYFRKLVREHQMISAAEAVYKATLLPCKVLGISSKGILKEGYDADITCMDINTIHDTAKMPHIGEPDALPSGIPYVMVSGNLVVDNGDFTNKKSGKSLVNSGIINQ